MGSDLYRARALVTGASSGIGREIARLLARDGHDLVITARTSERLEALAGELERDHRVAVHVAPCDISSRGAPEALCQEIRRAGIPIDILVNNAGVGVYGDFVSTDLGEELRMISLNVIALVELTKFYVRDMVPRRSGRILNVASTAGFVPGPLMAVYYASKAFVISFSEALADELRGSGVTVSVLCPGPTDTEFHASAKMTRSRLFQGTIMDARTVAEAGYAGMMKGQRVIVPGVRNKVVPLAPRLFPRRLVTMLSRRAAEMKP